MDVVDFMDENGSTAWACGSEGEYVDRVDPEIGFGFHEVPELEMSDACPSDSGFLNYSKF